MRLQEKFIRGGGPGGQKINKTASTVVLRDLDSGLEVRVSQERSLTRNRELAKQLLFQKIELQIQTAENNRKQEIEKIRRKNRKPSKAQQEKDLEMKRRHSLKKASRRKIFDD